MNCACADCARAGINKPPKRVWSNFHANEWRVALFGPKYVAVRLVLDEQPPA